MDSPAALAQAFKLKASVLRDIVMPHLTCELRMGTMLLDAMPAEAITLAFYEHVAVPHSEPIKNRNATFFLSDVTGTDPTLMALKAAWGGLPEDKQNDVWSVLPLLCGISKRFVKVTTA